MPKLGKDITRKEIIDNIHRKYKYKSYQQNSSNLSLPIYKIYYICKASEIYQKNTSLSCYLKYTNVITHINRTKTKLAQMCQLMQQESI